jgi:hypothetical protein
MSKPCLLFSIQNTQEEVWKRLPGL